MVPMTFMFLDFWIRFSCICNISSTSLPSLCSNAKHTPTFRSIYDKTDRSGRYSATWFRGGSWKKTSDKVQIVLIVEKHVGTKTWSKPIGSYENGTHTHTNCKQQFPSSINLSLSWSKLPPRAIPGDFQLPRNTSTILRSPSQVHF